MTNDIIMTGSLILVLVAVTLERWFDGGARKAIGVLLLVLAFYIFYIAFGASGP